MGYQPMQAVGIHYADFLALEFLLMDTRPGVKPDAFVADLVKRWVATERERIELRQNGPSVRGVQWKTLFLPEGTRLRTTFRGTVEFAKIASNRIVTDDGAVATPSQFANRHAQGRNAWRFIWLRFPGEECWVNAHACRIHQEEERASQP
jgi:hypothetical protein